MNRHTLIASLAASGFCISAQAAPLAQFDVGGDNGNGDAQSVQTDWTLYNPSNAGTSVASPSGITLTINDGSPESRDRTGLVIAGNPLENVFRDFFFTRSSDNPVSIVFGGLTPGSPYEITGYAYDASGGNDETGFWYLGSVAPENLQHFWTSSIATLDEGEDIFTLTGTADGNGELTYLVTTNNTSRINGFEVTLVPEPSSLALLGLGGLLVARRRRG